MTVLYGVFDEEESMYILYAIDFSDADLFVKERGLGGRLEFDDDFADYREDAKKRWRE